MDERNGRRRKGHLPFTLFVALLLLLGVFPPAGFAEGERAPEAGLPAETPSSAAKAEALPQAEGGKDGATADPSRIFFKPGKGPRPQVLGVDFRVVDPRRSVLVVTLDRPAPCELTEGRPDTLSLLLRNAGIPPLLQKRLDTQYFEGAVKSARAVPQGNGVLLVIGLREKVPYELLEKGAVLEIVFGTSEARSTTPRPVTRAGKRDRDKEAQASPEEKRDVPMGKSYEASSRDYGGERMSFEFVDADIRNILKLIAEVADLNIVWGSDVQGKVSMKLDNVPWDQALEMILKPNGLTYQIEDDVLWVAPRTTLVDMEIKEKERRGALMAQKRLQGLFEPKIIEYLTIKHRKAEELFKLLVGEPSKPGVLDVEGGESEEAEKGGEETGKKTKIAVMDIYLTYDAPTNIIIVNGVRSKVEKVKEIIMKMDVPQRQVMIEARVVEATTTFSRTLGVDWNRVQYKAGDVEYNFATNYSRTLSPNTGLGVFFANTALGLLIDATLGLAETRGEATIISAPRIMTQDAGKALIQQGTKVAVPSGKDDFGNIIYAMMDAMLKLQVTPKITSNNMVVMDIQVTDDQPDYGNAVEGNVPIKTKQAFTQMMVQSGETIVIGGIYKESNILSRDKTPWLSDVPVLGWMFQYEDKQLDKVELMIFLTPTVVSTRGEKL